MKSYQSSDSFHIVGQAWQVRIMLKQLQNQWGPHMTIKEMLQKINK
ncbi:Z-ring formation inhibitor MciZ [Paenibacillus sp. FA6]